MITYRMQFNSNVTVDKFFAHATHLARATFLPLFINRANKMAVEVCVIPRADAYAANADFGYGASTFYNIDACKQFQNAQTVDIKVRNTLYADFSATPLDLMKCAYDA